MTQDELLQLFIESNALLEGHFQLTSGIHSAKYFEKFALLQRPELTELLCKALAAKFADAGVQVVVGPAVGGILLAHEVAKALGTRAIFTERVGDKMELRRGFTIAPGERALVVEDVVTTGGSVREVLDVVREHGGNLAGVGLLVDRSADGADFGVPTHALVRLSMAASSYPPDDCPLCREGIPLTVRGSRKVQQQAADASQAGQVQPASDASQAGQVQPASAALPVSTPEQASDAPKVGVVLGSKSDLSVAMQGLVTLKALGIPYELKILSAHRTPDAAAEYAKSAAGRGVKVIVAGAGLAAHLAGVLAAHTLLPVIGLPMGGGPLSGVDALYSTVQMPPGTPVGSVAINGSVNAALLAARILGLSDATLQARLAEERAARAKQVEEDDREVQARLP